MSSVDQEQQRIDRWLWCARFFKTRSAAATYVARGLIRLTRNNVTQRIVKPSFHVRPKDRLVFAVVGRPKVIDVLAIAARRGPAVEARELYENLAPIAECAEQTPAPQADISSNERSRRPDKHNRRALMALKHKQQ